MDAWFYRKNGQENGPISASDLKRLADDGVIFPEDLVRPQSRESWTTAGKVKGLFPADLELDLGIPSSVPAATSSPSARPPVIPSQSSANVNSRLATVSPSAIALQQIVSDEVWKRLLALGLPTNDELFAIRLSGFRSRRSQPVANEGESKSLWKRASEKLSSMAESVEMQTQRYLIVSSDYRYWITNQLGALNEAWMFDEDSVSLKSTWKATKLTISFQPRSAQSEVEIAEVEFDVTRPITTGVVGSPTGLIKKFLTETASVESSSWSSFPLAVNISHPSLNTLFPATDDNWQVAMISLTAEAAFLHGQNQIASVDFKSIRAWCQSESCLTWLSETATGIQMTSIATSVTTNLRSDADNLARRLNSTEAGSEVQLPASGAVAVTTTHPSGRALAEIVAVLKNCCGDKESKQEMLAAALDATPLFDAPNRRFCFVSRDGQLIGESPESLQIIPIANRSFLRTSDGHYYEMQLDQRNLQCVTYLLRNLIQVDSEVATPESIVLLSQCMDLIDLQETITASTPYRVHYQADGKLEFESSQESPENVSFNCPSVAISKQSRHWSNQCGIAEIKPADDSPARLLVAPKGVLIRIWETRERSTLAARTRGVSLGEMYAQYNEMRIQKFLTGVFGNYFLAQQQLEARSKIDEFIQKVESAPPGVLAETLEAEFIERLSILEISRHQLNRWLDRCTLMYPHQQAEITRQWLREAFDPTVIDEAACEQEAWKAHHQTRAELRQVQASMNRAMAEVGQNLNVISFAFPEEVRCAALAATRRAASMAGKGAMLAAFAGAGGQVLLGLGRASMGDPLGVAMLGTVGLSLVGHHLEKNAKDTEKRMRIRAYGLQALQWWKVVMETASIMAVECHHNVAQLQLAGMQRDRKLLEKLPREKLMDAQKRMVAVMRRMLQSELGNQFYEAIPNSGVFGWHIVDAMSEMTKSYPKQVLKHFSSEIPGSIAKA